MGSFPFSSGQTYTRELTKKQEGKLLTGDFLVDLLNLEEESLPQNLQGIRKDRLKRKKKEDRRKAARKRRAAGTSLQHAKEEVQPRRRDLVREKQKTLSYKD